MVGLSLHFWKHPQQFKEHVGIDPQAPIDALKKPTSRVSVSWQIASIVEDILSISNINQLVQFHSAVGLLSRHLSTPAL